MATKADWEVAAGASAAASLWFVMFSPWTAPRIDFWSMMSLAAVTLTTIAALSGGRGLLAQLRPSLRQVAAGLALAAALWGVFWIGYRVAQALFGFAREQVGMIYAIKDGSDPLAVGALLLLLIGPAEEIFWRGFVQRHLSLRLGPNAGFLLATACYTLVHVWSLNFMLVMAAMVVGLCWGAAYRFFPRSLAALVVSHAVWDVCAFVLFPF